MKYDFNQVHSRYSTNCTKWDTVKTTFGNDDVIPMWVADMDFPAARPIVEALKKRAAHEFYGYTPYRRHNKIGKETIRFFKS